MKAKFGTDFGVLGQADVGLVESVMSRYGSAAEADCSEFYVDDEP